MKYNETVEYKWDVCFRTDRAPDSYLGEIQQSETAVIDNRSVLICLPYQDAGLCPVKEDST